MHTGSIGEAGTFRLGLDVGAGGHSLQGFSEASLAGWRACSSPLISVVYLLRMYAGHSGK